MIAKSPISLQRHWVTDSQTLWLKELLDGHSATVLTEARVRALRLGVAAVHIESRTEDVARTLTSIAKEKGAEAIEQELGASAEFVSPFPARALARVLSV